MEQGGRIQQTSLGPVWNRTINHILPWRKSS